MATRVLKLSGRGLERYRAMFWARVSKGKGCWCWTHIKNGNGYGVVSAEGTQMLAHRAAWTLTWGHIPSGLSVCHHCDNPLCVRPQHLFLSTQYGNVMNMAQKGRARFDHSNRPPLRGEKNGFAKLSGQVVRKVRSLHKKGIAQTEIGRRLGIPKANVWAIVHRKNWKHIGAGA